MYMRIALLLVALILSGCATMTYTSNRLASDVSECIASGWRKSPFSGYELPVSLIKTEEYYFVDVELHPTYPSPIVAGFKHPFYFVWAEVSESPFGSTTQYHRAYQIMRAVIDRVVVACQEPKQ
jgi:hypothetical protein